MFTQFFYTLKKRHVPVSLTEWMTLMEALSKGCVSSLEDFYYLARAILIKSETYFDQYDVAFQEYFSGIEIPADIPKQIMEWLKDALNWDSLTPQERAMLEKMSLDELLREFEKRLQEQTEQHDGGSYWIGRWGTSPFGHSGRHPAGIRIGGTSGGRGAIKIAQERRFRNYRNDLTLDVRQVKVALKMLRKLNRIGPADELQLPETIDATCKNAGELEFVWGRSRKNAVKLLLLMDVGGSMDPYARLCSQLFSAAHSSNHFKDFKYYYFHNCIYDVLYKDIEWRTGVSIEHIIRTMDPDYRVVLVGDACMATSELMDNWGNIYYYERMQRAGINRLKNLARHFTHCVWLNPEPPSQWNHPTINMIGQVFPMFELTLDGLQQAIKKLLVKR